MSLPRRAAVVTAAVVLAGGVAAPAAHADYTFYRTGPHVGACWQKVTAYGGVYQVTNNLLNGTSVWHTARVQVHRPGVGLQSDQSYTAAPGEWKVGATAHVAMVPNDEYQVHLDGVQVVGIPAHGIPYYMNHCEVQESPSVRIRQALSYGLAQLDAIYVGCAAGTYRFGTVPTATLYHDGTTCGQSRVYKQPAGVRGFDCSGLVHQMFQHAGVYFPWSSSSAIRSGVPQIAKSQLRVGDLLAKNGHVAVYLGDGNGDGVASVLEATPRWQNADGSWTGVMISSAAAYVNSSEYTAHRVSGT